MAAIFKIATTYFNILTTLYIAKWKCYWVNKSAIFGMMIHWEPIFHFGLGANLKKSNMAAIFKMATRFYKILITFLCSQMKCHQVNKSANCGMIIPWEPIFQFGLRANLKKNPIWLTIFKIATRYYKMLTTLYIAKWKCYWVNTSAIFRMMFPCFLSNLA